MALFGKNDRRFLELHRMLSESFENVKEDVKNVFSWLDFLYQKTLEQEQILRGRDEKISDLKTELRQGIFELKTELKWVPKSREELREIVDLHYNTDVVSRLRRMSDRLEQLERESTQDIHGGKRSALLALKERLAELEKKSIRKATLKEKILKKITKNSKDYIKNVILSLIKKYEKIGALQLREVVVEEQGLCSKSSFYRILDELDDLEEIGVLQKGKEKMYLFKAARNIH